MGVAGPELLLQLLLLLLLVPMRSISSVVET